MLIYVSRLVSLVISSLQFFDLGTLLPITMPGARGVNIDLGFIGRSFDLDARDARVIEPAL